MSKKITVGHGKYIIDNLIGKGSFGIVYKGHINNTNEPVAIKIENKTEHKLLEYEYTIYNLIYNDTFKIPKIHWFGTKGEFYILVMDYLGKSLEMLFNEQNRRFSLKTTCMIGVQICDLLENLHRKKIIHRDLKPDNFLIGSGDKEKYIFMIDYGLSKRFKNEKNEHMKQQLGKKLIGTSRYASINSHIGNDLSRRDDMESLFYLLIYFYRGFLPWQGVPGKTKEEKYYNIGKKKQELTSEDLCANLPGEFLLFIKHIKGLSFADKPNYKYLKSLLLNLLQKNNLIFDYVYDWSGGGVF